MIAIRKLEVEELENLVVGATVLSSGGGGSADNALGLIRRIAKKGLVPKLVDPKSLRSNNLIFAPGDVGGGITPELEKRFEDVYKTKIPIKWKNWPWDKWSPASIVELAKYLKREPNAFLAIESGPGSFLSVIYEAAKAGKPTVDGDTVGRAVPEMTMSKLFLNNARVLASASTSHFGDVIILKHVVDFRRMEDIVRSFAQRLRRRSGTGFSLRWIFHQNRNDPKFHFPVYRPRCESNVQPRRGAHEDYSERAGREDFVCRESGESGI